MKGKSHALLGQYLVGRNLSGCSQLRVRAFLFGCVQPDRNPATYLKGSLRRQWLRGHNWENAQRYMQRVSGRLERRRTLHIWDYYTLGKLVHYTTDAFTYAHNAAFPTDLRIHKAYEAKLQAYFLQYLAGSPEIRGDGAVPVMEAIRQQHRTYLQCPAGIRRDAVFSVRVCAGILDRLIPAAGA